MHAIFTRPIDVLIVEDDANVREALRMFLENEGYACAEAENGREAVEIADQSPPRLVLLDLMLPEVDGFEAARRLRSNSQTRKTPIHCVTARSDPAARKQARKLGCEAFLVKPVDVAELLDLVCVSLNSGSSPD